MALTFSGPMEGFRPRPFSILVRALGPPLAKRSLQSRTLGRLTPTVLAMVRFGIPSAAIRITLARRARPCGVLGARRQASSTRRWSSVTGSGAADAHIETAYMGQVVLSIYFSDATLVTGASGSSRVADMRSS